MLYTPTIITMATQRSSEGTPWEEIGVDLSDGSNIETTVKEAGLDWEVIRKQAMVNIGTEEESRMIKVDGNYVLLRGDTMTPISPFIGDRYKPVQNIDAFGIFKDFCEAGNMVMETAGSMLDGKHIWGLAKIQGDYELCNGEMLSGYFLLMQSHVYGTALRAMFTPVRYPGGHTLVHSLGQGVKSHYSMPHSRIFNKERVREIHNIMGLADDALLDYAYMAQRMAKKRLTEAEQVEYFVKIFNPSAYKRYLHGGDMVMPTLIEDLRTWEHSNLHLRRIPDYAAEYEGANLESCNGTAWGLLQATSYAFDHKLGRSPDTRLLSSWTGENQKAKMKAFEEAKRITFE